MVVGSSADATPEPGWLRARKQPGQNNRPAKAGNRKSTHPAGADNPDIASPGWSEQRSTAVSLSISCAGSNGPRTCNLIPGTQRRIPACGRGRGAEIIRYPLPIL